MANAQQGSTLVKITQPRLGHIYPRTRLFEKLDVARERPIVWISAPPGAGKTTLASSYLAENNLKGIWYQLDEGDADIASFFYYMSIAAKKAAPRQKQSLPLFTPEYSLGLSTFARRYFEKLYSWLKPPFVIVLDNYQTLPADSLIHEAIRDGIEQMPEGGNAIIISREDPLQAYARLRANQDIALIDWNTLKLDNTELGEIMRLKNIPMPDENELEQLQSHTGGWLAGLLLLLESVNSDSAEQQLLNNQSHQVVFDYFATEILAQQSKETQTFLLQASLLPRMTPEMVNKLTASSRADKILEELQQKNYFIECLSYNESLYQLHPLYREFLQTQARENYSEEDYSDLQQRAAQVLDESGQVEAAIQLYLSSANWGDSIRLVCGHALELVTQGRGETVTQWIQQIPDAVYEQTAWLQFWSGVSRMMSAPLEGREQLEKAYRLFKRENDLTGMCLSLSSIVDTFSFGWNDFYPLDDWIIELEALMASHPELPSPEIQARITVAMFVSLMYRQPQHPDMELWTQRTREISRYAPSANDRVIIGLHLASYYVWWGRHSEMELLLDELRPLLERDDISPMGFITFRAIEAMYYTRSHTGDGVQTALDGLKRAEQSGVFVINALLLGFASLSSINAANMDAAAAYLNQLAMMFHPARLMDTAFYHWNRGHLAWLQGDLVTAVDHVRQSADIAKQFGSQFHNHMVPITLAKILVVAGEYAEAKAIIEEVLPGIEKIGNPTLLYESMLIEASRHFAQHEDDAGVKALQEALKTMRQLGSVSTIWWNPKWFVPLLAKALQEGIEVEYVQSLIRTHKINPDDQYIGIEQWPWPIKITTFGGFTLLINDEPALAGSKAQNKPIELLKALIAACGKDVTVAQLADNLWPDAEGDDASHSLKTTLHRLRKLLDNDQAIQVTAGKLSLNPRYCWSDTWAFNQLLAMNNIDLLDHNEEKAHYDRLQQAINLYKGAFLDGEKDITWALVPAEKMRNQFLLAVEKYGAYQEKCKRWENAIECYKSGINTDELAEALYQRLMICYAQTGRHGEALALYENYSQILDSRFGVKPSKETRDMAEKLGA